MEWLKDGNLIYCLKSAGWDKGKEIFQNDITINILGHEQDKERVEELRRLILNFLNFTTQIKEK